MLLSQISKFCQKHTKLAFGFIGAAIIIPFVFLGRMGGNAPNPRNIEIGKMYGKKIDHDQFYEQLYATETNILIRTGQLVSQKSQWHNYWIDATLNRIRTLREAKKLGLDKVSDKEVVDKIHEMPMFQKDDKFNGEAFKRFKKFYLTPKKITGGRFDEIIREDIILERLNNYVKDQVVVGEEEIRQGYNRENKEFFVTQHEISSFGLKKDIKIADKEKKEYFDLHKEDYRVPIQREYKVVTFDAKNFTGLVENVADEDIKTYYDEHKKDFDTRQVKARHILIKVSKDDTKKIKKEKKTKLEKILQQIKDGADFAESAKKNSEGPSAKKGGDLGWFGQGRMAKPFEDMAFIMEKGKVSPIVETTFGYHIIKVDDKKGKKKTLKEAKKEVLSKVKLEKAVDIAKDAAAKFTLKAYNTVQNDPEGNAEESFSKLATKKKLKLKTTKAFAKNGYVREFGYQFARNVFAFDVENPISEVVENKNKFYVACFSKEHDTHIPEYEKDKKLQKKIEGTLKNEKAMEKAKTQGNEVYNKLKKELDNDKEFEIIAKYYKFKDIKKFTQKESPRIADVTQIKAAVESAESKELLPPIKGRNSYRILFVKKVKSPSDKQYEKDKKEYKKTYIEKIERQALTDFNKRLEDESETELTDGWKAKK
ncbi:MAG: peptidylprolyl isomerase [Verrucomicrobiota bacterium]|nr:peptidylprolyl isomerase [Verrucomicrobiota bacterium]